MNLSALGDLGDFIGGIGVVATLVYLAVQIRANTRAVRSASLDAVATSHFGFQQTMGQDPGLAKLWFDGLSGRAELSETDSQRLLFLLLSMARQWERAFLMGRAGTLDSAAWRGLHDEYVRIFSNAGAQRYWKLIRAGFSADFVDFVESETRAGGRAGAPAAPTLGGAPHGSVASR